MKVGWHHPDTGSVRIQSLLVSFFQKKKKGYLTLKVVGPLWKVNFGRIHNLDQCGQVKIFRKPSRQIRIVLFSQDNWHFGCVQVVIVNVLVRDVSTYIMVSGCLLVLLWIGLSHSRVHDARRSSRSRSSHSGTCQQRTAAQAQAASAVRDTVEL